MTDFLQVVLRLDNKLILIIPALHAIKQGIFEHTDLMCYSDPMYVTFNTVKCKALIRTSKGCIKGVITSCVYLQSLTREDQGLSFQHFGDIKIEEVTIKDCLDTSSNDGYGVKEGLCVESVDPVQDVEATVRAQGKEVVTCDGLSLSCLAHHEELR